MELIDLIKSRRSIRKFKDTEISKEVIGLLLESAIWAPSGGNMQPWKFIVAQNKDLRAKLALAAHGQEYINEAPTSIVVCIDKSLAKSKYAQRGLTLYSIQDTAAAVQNILLMAHSMNLGTCWIGAFDEDLAGKALGLDDNFRPVAIIPIGYTDIIPVPPARKPIAEVVVWK